MILPALTDLGIDESFMDQNLAAKSSNTARCTLRPFPFKLSCVSIPLSSVTHGFANPQSVLWGRLWGGVKPVSCPEIHLWGYETLLQTGQVSLVFRLIQFHPVLSPWIPQ